MRAQLLIIALLPRIRCHCPKSRSAATKRALKLKAAINAIPAAEITNAVALLKERDKQCMVDDEAREQLEAGLRALCGVESFNQLGQQRLLRHGARQPRLVAGGEARQHRDEGVRRRL